MYKFATLFATGVLLASSSVAWAGTFGTEAQTAKMDTSTNMTLEQRFAEVNTNGDNVISWSEAEAVGMLHDAFYAINDTEYNAVQLNEYITALT